MPSVCHICCVISLNTVPVEGLLVSPKICHGNRLRFSLIYSAVPDDQLNSTDSASRSQTRSDV